MTRLSVTTFSLPADHPVFAGHFPAQPIIPGALILDEVVRCTSATTGHGACVVRSAKFAHPASPGQTLEIALTPSAREGMDFRVTAGDILIASGTVCAA